MAARCMPESHVALQIPKHRTAAITPFTKETFLATFTLKYSSLNGEKKLTQSLQLSHTHTNKVH